MTTPVQTDRAVGAREPGDRMNDSILAFSALY